MCNDMNMIKMLLKEICAKGMYAMYASILKKSYIQYDIAANLFSR